MSTLPFTVDAKTGPIGPNLGLDLLICYKSDHICPDRDRESMRGSQHKKCTDVTTSVDFVRHQWLYL
jgi:hypothetical protein